MITYLLSTKTTKNFTVELRVINSCEGSPLFNELYTASAQQEGITIEVPNHLKQVGDYDHYIGPISVVELEQSYIRQNEENPKEAAYNSLQRELAHYIEANDCYFKAIVKKGHVVLAEVYGPGFDYSYDYCGDIEEYAKQIAKEYSLAIIKEAIGEARQTLKFLCYV